MPRFPAITSQHIQTITEISVHNCGVLPRTFKEIAQHRVREVRLT